MKKDKTIYMCDSCGNEFPKWSGRCEMCGEWNTLKELTGNILGAKESKTKGEEIDTKKLSEIKISKDERATTGIGELDRVFGGGIVSGSVALLGGEPGIGKSTIIMEMARNIENLMYVSGEESLSQIKLRADRLDVDSKTMTLIASGDIESVEREVHKYKPKLLVVDSIQTSFLRAYPSTPGSLVQVRECGIFLQRLAKKKNIPIIIIGHVTKEGNIAGPRLLEHLVDVVLYMEGERFHDARILRSIKNRFGPTNETGVFVHTEKGLKEVKNPSKLFLQDDKKTAGNAVAVVLEGSRPILVEIQALVTKSSFGYPKRTSAGVSLNRLNLLAAVITKNSKTNLSNSDIYLKVSGGLSIAEPAIDLAIVAAIISSHANKAIKGELAFFGEIGLGGEVRRVTRESQRVREATNLGFKPFESKNKSINNIAEEIL